MNKIDTLIKQIEKRIAQIENDKLIDVDKKSILISENNRFLSSVKRLFAHSITPSYCNCTGGAKGRIVTADFEHQVCEQCGKIAK